MQSSRVVHPLHERPVSAIERTREELGIRAKGRKLLKSGEAFQLREPVACYNGISGIKNDDIGAKNGYFWNINLNIST